MIFFSKRLPKNVRENLVELQRMESYFSLAADLAAKNTALLNPHGKQFANQLRTLKGLISEHKNNQMAQVLAQMGYKRAQVNIQTGHIKPMPDEPKDNPTTE